MQRGASSMVNESKMRRYHVKTWQKIAVLFLVVQFASVITVAIAYPTDRVCNERMIELWKGAY
jgi:hypothetical protein